MAELLGKLQRMGVDAFFGYGEQQDFKDASKQIATIGQGGLGMPERDYYLRTGEKDVKLREEYVAHVAKMLTLAGSTPEQAAKDAHAMMAMETALAKASLDVTTMRDPEKIYHLKPIAAFTASLPGVNFTQFEDAVHSPHVTEINDSTPEYFPALTEQIQANDMETIKAYLRYHLLTTAASQLPKKFDEENFDFYGRKLSGQPEQRARWKRCSNAVNGALGEALGKVYVEQYFAGDSKAKMLEMVHDIENAMNQDIDQLHVDVAGDEGAGEGEAARGGEQDRVSGEVARLFEAGDQARTMRWAMMLRANEFENDRQLAKIGKPVDHNEWGMTPPTVNAYYDPSMNNINFPAGILQPPFYDKKQDDAVNYGHIGADDWARADAWLRR